MSYLEAAEELRSNEEQWRAYESTGHCVLLAGPGSGKTKVLTIKIARMLSEDVFPPKGIACVTYNNECVRELRKRFNALGVGDSDRLFVGTVHAFCLRHILGPYAHLTDRPLPEPFRLASDADRERLVGAAIEALAAGGNPASMLPHVERHRRECIARSLAEGWEEGDRLTDLCTKYEDLLEREGLLDYESIIQHALALLEQHEWIRRAVKARFPILAVDEYQDLGRALHRVVHLLCFDAGTRLFAVGDPDQSIYGFTGAHPELLEQLAVRPHVQKVRLKLNYRSAREIVDASAAALGEARDYEPANTDTGLIQFHRCEDGIDDEVATLIDTVLPDVLNRFPAGNVVVLFPTKYEGDRVEAALKTAGHAYVKLGRHAAYQRTPLTRLVEDMACWCAGGWREGSPRLSQLIRRWTSLQGLVDPDTERVEKLKLVRFLFENRTPEARAHRWLSKFEQRVLQPNDCRHRLLATGDVGSFDDLREATAAGHRLEQFTVRNLGGQAGSPDHLNLLTLHSSKGCEFDVVILVGADDGTLPRYGSDDARIEEARRLFYVGISRARREVHIIYSDAVDHRYRQGPSPFARDVASQLGEDL